jgi:hypothetical protein
VQGGPFLCPDGDWIGFTDQASLKKVAVFRRSRHPDLPAGRSPFPRRHVGRGRTVIFAMDNGRGLMKVGANGGTPDLLIKPGLRDEDQRFVRFHLTCAARRAISRRRWAVSAAARAWPPFRPPSRPSATADGFLATTELRRIAVRSVGAPHASHGGPISSVDAGSRHCCSASHTRHCRRTSINAAPTRCFFPTRPLCLIVQTAAILDRSG